MVGKKKAQITVFIILALALIGLLSFYFLTRTTIIPPIQSAPAQIAPIAQMVQDCLDESAKTALNKIGANGGYIEPNSAGVVSSEDSEGDLVRFAPKSKHLLPFWWYLKSQNTCTQNCEFNTKKPLLYRNTGGENSIEGQMNAFMPSLIKNCTNDFKQFKETGYDVNAGNIKVTSSVNEKDVSFVLDWPLQITIGDRFSYSQWEVKEEVPLFELYSMASEISVIETNSQFLERHIMQLISSYGGLRDNALPPIAYATFNMDFGKKWIKEDVRKKTASLIVQYMPMLRLWGSRDSIFLDAPKDTQDSALWSRIYNMNMMISLQENHPDIQAGFSVLDWWKQYFDLNCKGQMCGADSIVNTYGFPFGFQKYNFAYDISTPVLVELRAPDALNQKGYSFMFAMEANIRNNEPMPFDFVQNPATESTDELFCDDAQKNSGDITVNVADSKGAPSDTTLTFSCGQQSCPIGESTNGVWKGKLPKCLGGEINAVKENTYSAGVKINTVNEEPVALSLTIDSAKNVEISFQRVEIAKSGTRWVYTGNTIPAKKEDQLIAMLARKGDPGYSSNADVCGSGVSIQGNLSLVPGDYDVSLMLMSHKKITFQKAECTGQNCEQITDNDLNFGSNNVKNCDSGNPLSIGGANFLMHVTPEMIDTGKITFFVPTASIDEIPSDKLTVEDMTAFANAQQGRGYAEAGT